MSLPRIRGGPIGDRKKSQKSAIVIINVARANSRIFRQVAAKGAFRLTLLGAARQYPVIPLP
jgi:hypothetical protein